MVKRDFFFFFFFFFLNVAFDTVVPDLVKNNVNVAPIIISDISQKENWGVVGSEQTQLGIFCLVNYNIQEIYLYLSYNGSKVLGLLGC